MTDLTDLGKRLYDLDTTQQSIQKASEEIINLAKSEEDRIKDLANLWKTTTLNKQNKLPLLYLANDIIQNSHFQGLKIHEAMFDQLLEAFPKVFELGGSRLRQEIIKLIDIWEERTIYDTEKLANLKGLLNITDDCDLTNPNIVDYMINNKIRINPKIPELGSGLYNLQRHKMETAKYMAELDEGKEEVRPDLERTLMLENKAREVLLRDAADLIKKESLIFSKHVHYLVEIDRLLDKINSYKKLDSMQVDG
jgi:hypothetical protein